MAEEIKMTREEFDRIKSIEAQYQKELAEKAVKEKDALELEKFKKIKDEMLAEIKKQNTPKKAVFNPQSEPKEDEFPVKTFKDYLEMVRTNDPRIAHMRTKTIADPESSTSAQGGYTIPQNWRAEIIGSLNEQSVAFAECTPVEIAVGNSVHLNKILTDITVAWSTEATDKNTTKPTLSQADLSLRFIYAIIARTQELANGTITNWDMFHKQLVAENFGLEFDAQILQSNANPFTGILNAVGVNAVAQAGASLAYPDLTAVTNNAGQLAQYKVGAKWWMTLGALDAIMNIVDNNGRPLWSLNDPMAGKPSAILGYPYAISNQITDTISAAGTTSIVFGNMKNEFKGVRPGGPTLSVLWTNTGVITTSTAVTYNLFQANMEAWRFEMEVGFLTAWPAAFTKLTGVKP